MTDRLEVPGGFGEIATDASVMTPAGLQSNAELARRRRIVLVLNVATYIALLSLAASVLGAGGWTVVAWIMFVCFAVGTPWTVLGFWPTDRALQPGQTVLADKGFAGEEFEQLVASHGCQLLRPDRKNEQPRHGSLGGVRQWIESIIQTTKGQLSLERHGARTLQGLIARIAQRLLALAAGCWHNWQTGNPGRHFTAYDH